MVKAFISINIRTDSPKLNIFFDQKKDLPFDKEKDFSILRNEADQAGLTIEEINVFFRLLAFYHGINAMIEELNK